MSIEELKELCALTVELTKLRQAECKHLCIENFAPELLGKLIRERMGGAMEPPATVQPVWVQPVIVQPQWVPQPAWAPPWTVTCGAHSKRPNAAIEPRDACGSSDRMES